MVEATLAKAPQPPTAPIARRPKEVHPTTLYGLRACDLSNSWFAGNEAQMLDGGPDVGYVPTFKSEEDARKYLADAGLKEAVPNGDNDEAFAIMALAVVGASGETSKRSETSVADKGRELIEAN